jgi:AcrR family transcriptional regulator
MAIVDIDTGEATRDKVLRLADALFARRGYAAVSMRDVALAAGVTKPALYYHFRDKDALFTECLLIHQLQLGERLHAAIDVATSLGERVTAAAQVLLLGAAHHPERTRSDVVEHLSESDRQRIASSFDENVMGPISRLFEEAQIEGGLRDGVTARVAAVALVAVCTAGLPGLDGSRPPDAGMAATLAGQIADLVLNGAVG